MEDVCDLVPPTLSEYRTSKSVVIRSAWLKLPHLVFSSVALLWVIFTLVYKLQFMRMDSVAGGAEIRLKNPMENYDTCTDLDMDCLWRKPNFSLPYCQDMGMSPGNALNWGNHSANYHEQRRQVRGCQELDIHEPFGNSLPTHTILVPTMVTEIKQRKCYDWEPCQGHGGWLNSEVTDHFVSDIESFALTLAHTWHTQSLHGSGAKVQGFLEEAGELKILSCKADCGRTHLDVDFPFCGSTVQHDGHACFASALGDVLSISRLLQAAGVDLDEPRSEKQFGNLSFRVTGLTLSLEIIYSNLDLFWRGGLFTEKMMYRYRASLDQFGVHEAVYSTHVDSAHSWQDHRVLRRHTGIIVNAHVYGTVGTFSWMQLIMSVAGSLALLKIVDIFVERLLVPIYGCFPRGCPCSHVAGYFTLYKNDDSIEERRFVKRQETLLDQSSPHHALEEGLRQSYERAMLMRQYSEITLLQGAFEAAHTLGMKGEEGL